MKNWLLDSIVFKSKEKYYFHKIKVTRENICQYKIIYLGKLSILKGKQTHFQVNWKPFTSNRSFKKRLLNKCVPSIRFNFKFFNAAIMPISSTAINYITSRMLDIQNIKNVLWTAFKVWAWFNVVDISLNFGNFLYY